MEFTPNSQCRAVKLGDRQGRLTLPYHRPVALLPEFSGNSAYKIEAGPLKFGMFASTRHANSGVSPFSLRAHSAMIRGIRPMLITSRIPFSSSDLTVASAALWGSLATSVTALFQYLGMEG